MNIWNFCKSTLIATAITANGAAVAEITGPSTLTTANGTSEVLAWSWGASQSGSFHTGGGGGEGKANFQDIAITRLTDLQSPQFIQAVATGQFFGNVIIERGGLTIELISPTLVSSYSLGGTSDKRDPQVENITINFSKVKFTVEGTETCWDVVQNESC